MHPINKAAKVVGTQKELAQRLGITPSAVNQWITTGVPAERCPAIERMTNGQVTCEELRPDVDWGYLRASAPRTEITSS